MMSAGGSIAKVGFGGDFPADGEGRLLRQRRYWRRKAYPNRSHSAEAAMSGTLEDRLDLVLHSRPQRLRQHEAEQVQRETTIRDAHAELEHKQEKFCTEVRSLLEQTVDRANRHLATRPEKWLLGEVSGYFTGPLFVEGSACNPIAYELRRNGREGARHSSSN